MNQNSRGTRTTLPSDLPPAGDEEDLHSSPASGLAWSSNADEPLDYGPSVAPSVEPRAPYKPPVDEDDLDDEDERSIAVRRNGFGRVRSEAGSRPVFRSASADDDRPFRGRDTSSNIDPAEEAAYGLGDERPARETRSNREPGRTPSTPFKAASGVSALVEHPIAQQLLHNAGSLPFVGGSVRKLMSTFGVTAATATAPVAARRLNEDVQQEGDRELPQIGESDEGSRDSEAVQKTSWKNKKVIGGAAGVVVFALWLLSGSSEPSGTPVKADGEHAKTMLAPDASKTPSDSEPLRAGMSLDGDKTPPIPVAAPIAASVAAPVAAPFVAAATAPASSPAPAAAPAPSATAATSAVAPPWAGGMTLSPASSAAANAAAQALVGTPQAATPAPATAPTPTPAPVAAVKAEDPTPPGAEDAKPAVAAPTPVAPLAASAAPVASAASTAKAASAAVAPSHQAVAKPALKKAASAQAVVKTAKQSKPASGETQADREQVKALNQQLDQLLAK